MCGEVRRTFARVVRLHVGGDFYSADYVRKWVQIVRRCPDVVFYAYSRSWRKPLIARDLRRLSREPNMFLWLSADHDTGRPPRWRSARIAWMATSDDDLPPYSVDLVFRVQRSTEMLEMAGRPVCPHENGVLPKPTCSTCRICFSKQCAKPKRQLSQLMTNYG
jgi:hypothetical protein